MGTHKARPQLLPVPLPVLLAFLVIASPIGCAHTPPAPTPLAATIQATFGTIGVVTGRYTPEVEVRRPEPGEATGAVIGAGKGLGLGLLGAAGCFLTVGQVPQFCVLAVATPYFTLRYAVDQANHGLTREEITTNAAAITAAFASRTLQDDLRTQVAQLVGAYTPWAVVAVPEAGPATPGAAITSGPLREKGVDTVLAIEVQQVALRLWNPSSTNASSLWSISPLTSTPPCSSWHACGRG